MSKNTSINLSDHFNSFIGIQVEHGRYGSASEFVHAALRLLENQETKLNALRVKFEVSEAQADRSEFTNYNVDQLIEELDQENVV